MTREVPDKVVVNVYDATFTLKGELTQATSITSQHVPGDLGNGSCFVPIDDPYLDSLTIRSGDIIRADQGATAGFPWVVEKAHMTHLTRGGKARVGWQISGSGLLSKWVKARVYPPLGPGRALFGTTRWWNWAAPELDSTAWDDSVVTEKALVGENFGFPDLWADADAYWMWDRLLDGGLGTNYAPAGDVFFATTFTKDAYGFVEHWGTADDAHEQWVDGVPVMSDQGYYRGKTQRKKYALDAGTHHIAIKGTNQNALKAGVLSSGIEINADGTFGDVIWRSDDTWKCLAYPATPPGFTAGKILRILHGEALDRGALDGWAVSFTDTQDSEGNDFPELAEFPAPIGGPYYSVLRQLQETDLDVDTQRDALTLGVWNAGFAGSDLSATVGFDLPTNDLDVDQLADLSHDLENVFELAR